MDTATTEQTTCWICGSSELVVAKRSSLAANPTSEDLRITDKRYGVTLELSRCQDCGFLQCTDDVDLVGLYTQLEDPSYEQDREQRGLQQRKLLELLAPFCRKGRMLDIGAGTGMLVEQALRMGYAAEGVEPSVWQQRVAAQLGLPVYQGVFPHSQAAGPYDVITVVDVIEHVTAPGQLLRQIRSALVPGGIVMLVTPNARSLAARLMGWRWWHYRVAHVGYFDDDTLRALLNQSGFEILAKGCPTWYFTAEYLLQRVKTYVPFRMPESRKLKEMTVPLNLHDSMYFVCRGTP